MPDALELAVVDERPPWLPSDPVGERRRARIERARQRVEERLARRLKRLSGAAS